MKRAKYILLAINLALVASALAICYFYITGGYSHTLKWLGSTLATLCALVNLTFAFVAKRTGKAFYICMVVGLALASLGDALIDGNFVLGAATFALGHVSFAISYCLLQHVRLLDGILCAVLFALCLCLLLFAPFIAFDSPILQAVCILYALIICSMLGKAVGNLLRAPSVATVVLVAASVLFFFSDLMLALNWFASLGKWASTLCLATYYPSLCLLALGTWGKVTEKPKNS